MCVRLLLLSSDPRTSSSRWRWSLFAWWKNSRFSFQTSECCWTTRSRSLICISTREEWVARSVSEVKTAECLAMISAKAVCAASPRGMSRYPICDSMQARSCACRNGSGTPRNVARLPPCVSTNQPHPHLGTRTMLKLRTTQPKSLRCFRYLLEIAWVLGPLTYSPADQDLSIQLRSLPLHNTASWVQHWDVRAAEAKCKSARWPGWYGRSVDQQEAYAISNSGRLQQGFPYPGSLVVRADIVDTQS